MARSRRRRDAVLGMGIERMKWAMQFRAREIDRRRRRRRGKQSNELISSIESGRSGRPKVKSGDSRDNIARMIREEWRRRRGGVHSLTHSPNPGFFTSRKPRSVDHALPPSLGSEPIWRRWKSGRSPMPRGSNKDKNGKILEGTSLANAAGIFGWVSGINAVG